jgi:hypothetical protein
MHSVIQIFYVQQRNSGMPCTLYVSYLADECQNYFEQSSCSFLNECLENETSMLTTSTSCICILPVDL